jgi:hypothetical protein
MSCEHRCYEMGGPWITVDPDCPIHGTDAQAEQYARDERKESIHCRIREAETVEDLKLILHAVVEELV